MPLCSLVAVSSFFSAASHQHSLPQFPFLPPGALRGSQGLPACPLDSWYFAVFSTSLEERAKDLLSAALVLILGQDLTVRFYWFLIPTLQRRKPRPKESKQLTQGHRASKWQSLG